MIKPAFIDLSHHNTVPESFEATAAAGIAGVIHKCTEGSSNVDSKSDARFYLARQAGMKWGLYHFVRPGDMAKQVDWFLKNASEISDEDTLYALDWEDTNVSLNDAISFMQMLEARTGHSPVLYSGHVLKEALKGKPSPELSKYRLWLAQYASAPTLPPGWSTFWGWQYTDQGSVPGITPPTDLNAFDGTYDQLIEGWSGAIEDYPMPEPEPEPIDVTITVIVPPGVSVRVVTSR